jgi:hypothetical protein
MNSKKVVPAPLPPAPLPFTHHQAVRGGAVAGALKLAPLPSPPSVLPATTGSAANSDASVSSTEAMFAAEPKGNERQHGAAKSAPPRLARPRASITAATDSSSKKRRHSVESNAAGYAGASAVQNTTGSFYVKDGSANGSFYKPRTPRSFRGGTVIQLDLVDRSLLVHRCGSSPQTEGGDDDSDLAWARNRRGVTNLTIGWGDRVKFTWSADRNVGVASHARGSHCWSPRENPQMITVGKEKTYQAEGDAGATTRCYFEHMFETKGKHRVTFLESSYPRGSTTVGLPELAENTAAPQLCVNVVSAGSKCARKLLCGLCLH